MALKIGDLSNNVGWCITVLCIGDRLHFMFCWPCISIDPCNENQLDALFIISLFRQSTSTCFKHICSPSSGGTLCMYNNLFVDWVGLEHPNPANRQSTKKHNTYQLLYIYSVPHADGLQICPKHIEVEWRLRINSASSWFSLHETDYTIQGIQFSTN